MIFILERKLTDICMPFRIEDFNAKDFWWGSLPAIHTAAVLPPICGFDEIEDLLVTIRRGGDDDVPDESFSQEASQDFR